MTKPEWQPDTNKDYWSKVARKEGNAWVLRVIDINPETGKKVERTPSVVGYVKDFPTIWPARGEVGCTSVADQLNTDRTCNKIRFGEIVEHYIANELWSLMVVKRRSHNTINCYVGNIRRHLIDRWGSCYAEEIERFQVEQWSYEISKNRKGEEGLTSETVSGLRDVMVQIVAHAQRNKLFDPDVKYNPVRPKNLVGHGTCVVLTVSP